MCLYIKKVYLESIKKIKNLKFEKCLHELLASKNIHHKIHIYTTQLIKKFTIQQEFFKTLTVVQALHGASMTPFAKQKQLGGSSHVIGCISKWLMATNFICSKMFCRVPCFRVSYRPN